MGLSPFRAESKGPVYSPSKVLSSRALFIGGVPLIGVLILNFCGVLMSLKSIFSGVSGIRSTSPSRRRFRGVERNVTPNLGGEFLPGVFFGGVRTVDWKVDLFRSMSGDHVTGRRLRPEIKEQSVCRISYYIYTISPFNMVSYDSYNIITRKIEYSKTHLLAFSIPCLI